MSRFEGTHVFNHLVQHYTNQRYKLGQISLEAINAQKKVLLEELQHLPQRVILPAEAENERLEEILRSLGVQASDTAQGRVINHPLIKEKIYHDSVIGQIEGDFLRHLARLVLANNKAPGEIEKHVEKVKREHQTNFDLAWSDYHDEMSNFEDGDYGYDYNGPILPQQPDIEFFNADAVRQERIDYLESISLETILECKEYLSEITFTPDGFLGDLLHEWFYDVEAYNKIIDVIDCSKISMALLNDIFRGNDFFFPDFDILKDGFLLDILIYEIKILKLESALQLNPEECIRQLLATIPEASDVGNLLQTYNSAVDEQEDLTLQRIWYYLVEFCDTVNGLHNKYYKQKKSPDPSEIWREIEKSYRHVEDKKEHSLKTLIKVLPTDSVEHVSYYDRVRMETITMALHPCFYTLEYIAKQGHGELVKAGGDPKTNVVTAMLCFVVSASTLEKARKQFIKIPLDFDYSSRVISMDEAFTGGKDDVERSIAETLQLGSELAGRQAASSESVSEDTIKRIHRLVDTYDISEEDKDLIIQKLKSAPVKQPHAQAYHAESDVSKSTLHRHSERSLHKALGQPENTTKIVVLILKAISDLEISGEEVYTIFCGALLAYSYPNSICDPCGISFLGLLLHSKSPFITEFNRSVAQSNSVGRVKLKIDSNFNITAIAGSGKIFPNDEHAKMLGIHYKYPHYPIGDTPQQIWLSEKEKPWFYEFIDNEEIRKEAGKADPYQGMLFMSGSKAAKIKSQKKKDELEKGFIGVVNNYNTSLS